MLSTCISAADHDDSTLHSAHRTRYQDQKVGYSSLASCSLHLTSNLRLSSQTLFLSSWALHSNESPKQIPCS